MTPLHNACQQAHHSIVQYLLQHQAHVNAQGRQFSDTPLHFAVDGYNDDNRRLPIVQGLVKKGADINAQAWALYTHLHKAITHQYSSVAHYLIDKGSPYRGPN